MFSFHSLTPLDAHRVCSKVKMLGKIIVEMHGYSNFQWDENYPQVQDIATDIKKGDCYEKVLAPTDFGK